MSVTGSSIWELKRYGLIQYNYITLSSVREYFFNCEKWMDDDICYEIATLRENSDDREYVEIAFYTFILI